MLNFVHGFLLSSVQPLICFACKACQISAVTTLGRSLRRELVIHSARFASAPVAFHHQREGGHAG